MTALSLPLDHPLTARLGWTLLHFLWQGAAVAAALSLALALMRNRSARSRYAAACGAMALLVALPAATFALLDEVVTPYVTTSATGVEPTSAASEPPLAASQVASGHDNAPVTPLPAQPLAPLHPLVVSTWIAGVVALSAWRVCGWLVLRRRIRTHSAAAPARVRDALDRLREMLVVRTAVSLAESAWVQVPAVVGVFRPMILLPASALTGLTAVQLEAILAHELAHVRRHDYLVNLLQAAAETVLFYHPATWWVSARVREERENCCDDVAAEACGDRVAYARALATLEGLRVPPVGLALAAAGGGSGPLMRRVRRLLGAGAGRDPGRSAATRPLGAVVIALACAAAPLAAARLEDRPAATDAAVTSSSSDVPQADPAAAGDIRPEDLVPDTGDYKVGPDDVLSITIHDLAGPGKATVKSTRIARTGTVSLPYVGQVKVAGLSEAEVERAIAAAYKAENLIENASVAVEITEARGSRFSVMGDVLNPGSYAVSQGDYRVMDALVAGGAGNEVEEVTIIRPTKPKDGVGAPGAPGALEGGPARVIRIPAQKRLAGEMRYNVVIRPGDVVRVIGGKPSTARLVATADGKLTFDGQPTTWEQVPELLGKVPAERRARTRLVLVPASDEMTLKQYRQIQARAGELVKQLGMKELATTEAEASAKGK